MQPDATLHFSVTVSDLDRSIAWYEEALGLAVVARQRNENAYTRAIVGFEDAVLEIAFLELPGPAPVRLELIEYVRPRGEAVALPTNLPGVAHIAFRVADIDAALTRVAAAGGSPVNPPVEIDRGVNRGMRACYLRDPDGFTIELMQPPPAADSPG
ncbi:MAG TPA: VOC family protein [Solirubrobacterales bacterium]|nr:VOC family protein [Solirubrobacterales bacterium]